MHRSVHRSVRGQRDRLAHDTLIQALYARAQTHTWPTHLFLGNVYGFPALRTFCEKFATTNDGVSVVLTRRGSGGNSGNDGLACAKLYPLPFTLYSLPFTLYPLPFTLYPLPFPLPFTLYPLPFTLYPFTLYPLPVYPLPFTLYPPREADCLRKRRTTLLRRTYECDCGIRL